MTRHRRRRALAVLAAPASLCVLAAWPGGWHGAPLARDAAPGLPAGRVATDAKPKLGRTEVLKRVEGRVRVRVRGRRRFVRVRGAMEVPDRSEIDATRGKVMAKVARVDGGTHWANVAGGRAVVHQDASGRTTFRLSSALSCPRAGQASSGKRRKRKRRSLFVKTDGGRFRTRGTYATGAASGTSWRTVDRCRSTRIRARTGTVVVRDLERDRTTRITAPASYTARRGAG